MSVDHKGIFKRTVLLAVIAAGATSFVAAQDKPVPTATKDISRDALLDRIHGGWAGMMIGGLEGLPHEFKYKEQPRDTLPDFTFLENGARSDDDNDFEWTHLWFMDKERVIKLPYARIAEIWKANMNKGVWVANKRARELMDQGVLPPDTGSVTNNKHAWYNLSGQFCVESYGLVAPGMPQTAADIGLHYARIAVSEEPLQATQFWTSLVSLSVFHTSSPDEMLRLALAAVDPESAMAEVVADARKAFHAHPDDWKAARQKLHEKWLKQRRWNDNSTPVNGAAVCLALLYGNGDFYRTLQYAMALGYDADCNAATAGAVLGAQLGFKHIAALPQFKMPDRYVNKTRPQLPAECKVSEQAATLLRIAERVILANGGERITLDGHPGYRVKLQQPRPLDRLPEKRHGPQNKP
ncbi:MAG: ADP-ribosylglycohydrolase family protein [Verrucomicrobia bacterium]|nr:ADP-ribosylglycohydrolase family protein [Verrucomicrobiota bacterium]